MPKDILAEMGSQVGLTPARQSEQVGHTCDFSNMPVFRVPFLKYVGESITK